MTSRVILPFEAGKNFYKTSCEHMPRDNTKMLSL